MSYYENLLQDDRAWGTPFITYTLRGDYWQNMSIVNILGFQAGYGSLTDISGAASPSYASQAIDTWLSFTASKAIQEDSLDAQIGIMKAKLNDGVKSLLNEINGAVLTNGTSGNYTENFVYISDIVDTKTEAFTYLHEIGHALGLNHTSLNYSSAQTVMLQTDNGVLYLGALDILAIQQLYGVNENYHAGSTTYNVISGSLQLNGSSTGIENFSTIWDSGGVDTIDASNATAGITIKLQPISLSGPSTYTNIIYDADGSVSKKFRIVRRLRGRLVRPLFLKRGISMAEFKLIEGIINLSIAKTWEKSKLEWQLLNVHKEDEPDTCLCGHYPIVEICELVNIKNQNKTIVGNCCVKKFLGLHSDKIFQSIRRLNQDETKSVNVETLDYSYKKQWISDWEHDFYTDIARKRKLSEKQNAKKLLINRKIRAGVTNSRERLIQSILLDS